MLSIWPLAMAAVLSGGCAAGPTEPILTFSGSVVGREGEVIRRQLARFQAAHPLLKVNVRVTPDAADQRHQLYVQWLNARASDPDVLQLDVIWTPEFAAAGWVLGLDRFRPDVEAFFPAAIAASRWNGILYALPWFADVGMLYRRSDLAPSPPRDFDELLMLAAEAQKQHGIPFGYVWQGARYEGLVAVFLEHLGGFGGSILDEDGNVALDSDAAVRALNFMRDSIYRYGVVPPAVLAWQEEQVRFAFQNGQAMFMRNWPYAHALLQDPSKSSVAGRFAVSSLPAAPGGTPTAALGGAALAINVHSEQPDVAYSLVEYLLQPSQMLERAELAGQYPARQELYQSDALARALGIQPSDVLSVINQAVPRPVTPVYTQLSGILQVFLHRALTRQQEPPSALREASRSMQALIEKTRVGSQEK